jgi:hypothetical protein
MQWASADREPQRRAIGILHRIFVDGSNVSGALQTPTASRSGEAPVWGQSDSHARGVAVKA